jgi:hypothetical protein
MLWNLGKLLVKGYSLLLILAVGGFIGANVAGCIPTLGEFFVNPEGRATPRGTVLRWVHGGWLLGAGGALAVAIVSWRWSSTRKGNEEEQRKLRQARPWDFPEPRGVLASAGVGAVCCGLLGALLGGTFLMLWFSLAYSPFSPDWDRTVAVERDRAYPRSRRGRQVHTTRHPVALYAFFAPTVLGAMSGAGLGGATAMRRPRQ